MIFLCPITDAVHFDHLAKVVSARLVYCKISSFVITKYFVGEVLEDLKNLFYHETLHLFIYCSVYSSFPNKL